MMKKQNIKLAIIGLGYVALTLAVEFGKLFETLVFDINREKIKNFISNFDLRNYVK